MSEHNLESKLPWCLQSWENWEIYIEGVKVKLREEISGMESSPNPDARKLAGLKAYLGALTDPDYYKKKNVVGNCVIWRYR